MTVYNVFSCQVPKQPNFWESIRPLISLGILFVSTTLWAACSPTQVLEFEPRTFYFMVGTVFSNIAVSEYCGIHFNCNFLNIFFIWQCRLIVSQMSSTRCELFNWFLFPLTISTICVLCWNFNQYEVIVLRFNTLLFTVLHLHYGICVVRQMCRHFNIYCFSLAKPETKSPELENLGKRM